MSAVEILDTDGDRVGRVSAFRVDSTTRLVSYDGSVLMAPATARQVALALLAMADRIEREA